MFNSGNIIPAIAILTNHPLSCYPVPLIPEQIIQGKREYVPGTIGSEKAPILIGNEQRKIERVRQELAFC